ncbi:hypothetical protein FRC14_002528 [Serendipita sp. 396]|nr:hypothetical protein FRC14_002528 [Serendipita sp. 396]
MSPPTNYVRTILTASGIRIQLSLSQPTRPVRAERRYSDSYEAALPQARIYARDCPIHLHITLESYDTQLLDLLNASSLKIQLVQQVRTQPTTDPAASSSSSSHPHTVHRLYKADASNNEIEEPVVIGSCWKSSGAQTGLLQTSNRRHYEAELIIRKDLKPSFTFPSLSLQFTGPSSLSSSSVILSISIAITILIYYSDHRIKRHGPGSNKRIKVVPSFSFLLLSYNAPRRQLSSLTRIQQHPVRNPSCTSSPAHVPLLSPLPHGLRIA